ncbi:TPA: hypothetical protein MHW59_13770 [Klebsiella pneumoniae]|nr:hypothetical protein [Klebsiella pneumoniae]
MKFVSFNINGLRARPHQLAAIVEKHQPDVIGLQETKVHDDMFPLEEVARLGYNVFYHGQKGHYGVALLTKETPIAVRRGFPDDGEEAQRRIIMAEIPSPFGNVTVINGYFPQGESRDHETKFPAKAAFYQNLLTHLHLLQDTLRHQGAWGYLVYAALFIIATLCLIPGSLLVIAGGMLFGPLTGSLLSFAAATLASSLSFLIARWLGRDLLQRYVGHTTVFQAIERGIARSGCDFLILTRLVPLFPYNIQNYAYGLTAIRFWPFTLISAVTTLPGLVIYSVMASELAREGVTLAFALKLSLAGGLLFALVQIGKRFARARRVAACSEEVRHDPT